MMLRFALVLAALVLADVAASQHMSIWLDEYVFRPNELNLMQHVINGSDGALVLAGCTVSRVIQPKGHKMLHRHNLLWTGRTACYASFRERSLNVTNTISCTPGSEVITGKREFVSTLNNAYGINAASAIMPTAFILPDQYGMFAEYIYSTAASGIWALKEDAHRGKGVVATPGRLALRQALEKTSPSLAKRKKGERPTHRFVMAQRFIDDQLLINNRPFVMRLWAVLSGGNPITRTYLYDGGLLLFGSEQNQKKEKTLAEEQERVQNLVVNIFQQNRSAALDPWPIADFHSHLQATTGSDAAFTQMWSTIERSTAATLAATVPSIRRTTSRTRMPRYQGGNVEVLGLDYVIDSNVRPWLVEVNYLPSMARKIIDCITPEQEQEEKRQEVAAAAETKDDGESKKTAVPKKKKTATKPKKREVCHANAMDLEKEAFLNAHLRVLAARHANLEANVAAATEAVQHRRTAATATAKNRVCSVSADTLRQVIDAEKEREAASKLKFSDLSLNLYQSLECIAAGASVACEAALPSPPLAKGESSSPKEPLSLQEKIQLNVEWGMAQVRRLLLGLENAVKALGGKKGRAGVPMVYRPLPIDAVMSAWLKLPVKERQGNAAAVLEKLCALETSIIEDIKPIKIAPHTEL